MVVINSSDYLIVIPIPQEINMKKLITIIILLSYVNSFAVECKQEVTYLLEGQTSPCNGFLFSPAMELKVRLLNDENLFLIDQAKIKDQKVQIYIDQLKLSDDIYQKEQQKSTLWRTAAEDATEKLVKTDSNRGWRDFTFIVVGIGLTCLGAWSLGQIK